MLSLSHVVHYQLFWFIKMVSLHSCSLRDTVRLMQLHFKEHKNRFQSRNLVVKQESAKHSGIDFHRGINDARKFLPIDCINTYRKAQYKYTNV